MRGYNEDGSKYLSPGVKWVGYFNGGEGFHTADWNYYGIQVGDPAHYGSHGCVNMYEAGRQVDLRQLPRRHTRAGRRLDPLRPGPLMYRPMPPTSVR